MNDKQDIRLTFDRVPEIYDQVRPEYPVAFFDEIFETLPDHPAVIEVGPGTGQATGALLNGGARVTAVEIGPHLAQHLAAKFASTDQLLVVNDSFEDADVRSSQFDGLVCATAYHWIADDQKVARPHAVLKPGGWVAIIDLIQVGSASDAGYFDRVQPIYESFGDNRHDWSPPSYETAMPPLAVLLSDSDLFETPLVRRVPWNQTYTAAQYRNLLLTYSGTQMMTEPERSNMVDQLVDVIDAEFGGVLTRPLVATLTLAQSRG